MTTLRTQWNTGRLYTKHGQRIVAEYDGDGTIRFVDHDRGIYGEFVTERLYFHTELDLQRLVQARYDNLDYHMGSSTGLEWVE